MESVRLKLNTIHNPGPGFMPFFLGLSLAILAVLAFFLPGIAQEGGGFLEGLEERGEHVLYLCRLDCIFVPPQDLWFLYRHIPAHVFSLKTFGRKGVQKTVVHFSVDFSDYLPSVLQGALYTVSAGVIGNLIGPFHEYDAIQMAPEIPPYLPLRKGG